MSFFDTLFDDFCGFGEVYLRKVNPETTKIIEISLVLQYPRAFRPLSYWAILAVDMGVSSALSGGNLRLHYGHTVNRIPQILG